MSELNVVVPAYRAENTIMRTLKSIKDSSKSAEIILVEDGVFDDLQHIVRSQSGLNLIIKTVNAGPSAARNTGLAAVVSKYVFFLDSDDYVSQDSFENLSQVLDETDADVAFGPWCFVYDDVPSPCIKVPTLKSNVQFIARWLQNECYVSCCVMWRTESLRRIGGWNESFRHNDDAELVIRALIAGAKVAVTHKGCGYYVQHKSPHRVSQAASAVASEAADRIFAMVSAYEAKSRDGSLRYALAAFAYEQARRAYRAGETKLGAVWHEKAKSLGLDRHLGTVAHKVMASILGLRTKERLARCRDFVPMFKCRFK